MHTLETVVEDATAAYLGAESLLCIKRQTLIQITKYKCVLTKDEKKAINISARTKREKYLIN